MGWLNKATAAVWNTGHRVGQAVATSGGQRPADDADFWYEPAGGASGTGLRISTFSAMQVTAVYACVKILAETVATLPLVTYSRSADGRTRTREPRHPLFELLHDAPNPRDTAYEFWELQMGHAALRGLAYAEKVPGRRGPVDQIWPLHPDRMQPHWTDDGRRVVYEYQPAEGGSRRILLANEVFRWNTLGGLSPISQHREAIGLSLATQAHGARFFGNSARPSGILSTEQKLGDDGRRNVRKGWEEAYGGVEKAGRVAVLEGAMKWQTVSMTSEDAQFLETRKFQVAEIARIFRVPPHMVGDLEKATFNNIEELGIEFVVYTLMPWLRRIEQAIRRDLIVRPDVFFSKFTVQGLLRGSTKDRQGFYQSAIQSGWLTRNEVRDLEDRNPLDGLDEPLEPLNMAPAGDAPARPARPESRAAEKAEELAFAAARRAVHREATAVERAFRRYGDANDLPGFAQWAGTFYGGQHPEHLAENLALPDAVAQRFCERRARAILEAAEAGEAGLAAALHRWKRAGPHLIAAISLQDQIEEIAMEGEGDGA